jgi:hypothetical protein
MKIAATLQNNTAPYRRHGNGGMLARDWHLEPHVMARTRKKGFSFQLLPSVQSLRAISTLPAGHGTSLCNTQMSVKAA